MFPGYKDKKEIYDSNNPTPIQREKTYIKILVTK